MEEDGSYWVDYRTAALSESGAVKLEIIAPDGTAGFLHQLSFPSTGGWQNWTTTRNQVLLSAGQHQLRMTIMEPLFNINWLEFSWRSTGTGEALEINSGINMYPNPNRGILFVEGKLEGGQQGENLVFDLRGRQLLSRPLEESGLFSERIELERILTGSCVILVREQGGRILARELVVIGD